MTQPNDAFDPDSDDRTPEQIFNADEWDQRPAPVGSPLYGPVTDAAALPAMLEYDIACRKCGYNLRGLAGDGLCPECGSPIALSLHGNLLRNCDPKWLGALRWGARLIVLDGCMLVCALVTIGLLGSLTAGMRGKEAATVQTIIVLLQIAAAIAFAIGLVGTWLMTQPDPSGTGEDIYGYARKIARVTTVFGAIGLAVRLALFVAVYLRELLLFVQITIAVAAVAGIIGWAALLRYIQKIALRIPDDALSRRARFLLYALTLSFSLLLLLGVWSELEGPFSPYRTVLGYFALVDGIPFAIFYLMNIGMMNRFAGHLAQLRTLARQGWAGR